MPTGHLHWGIFQTCPAGTRPWADPRTRWSDYIPRLALEPMGVTTNELEEDAGENEA